MPNRLRFNILSGVQEEVEIQCPFCGEVITVFVDPSVPHQSYIEDCSVCCRPIQFTVTCDEQTVVSIEIGRS